MSELLEMYFTFGDSVLRILKSCDSILNEDADCNNAESAARPEWSSFFADYSFHFDLEILWQKIAGTEGGIAAQIILFVVIVITAPVVFLKGNTVQRQ